MPSPALPLRIGCGAGYFLYIAKQYGHDVLGLDIDTFPLFTETTELFGVQRVIWRIDPFVRLPDLGRKFDLMTAHMICFNGHNSDALWGVPEWEFFLDDLAKHLTPRGRVWLELNQEYDGTFYTAELKEFFQKRAARIHQQKVIFNSGIRAPASTLSVARSKMRRKAVRPAEAAGEIAEAEARRSTSRPQLCSGFPSNVQSNYPAR